jgi:hypothetical protein
MAFGEVDTKIICKVLNEYIRQNEELIRLDAISEPELGKLRLYSANPQVLAHLFKV